MAKKKKAASHRVSYISVRCTGEEKRRLERDAKQSGMLLSDFIRKRLKLERAR